MFSLRPFPAAFLLVGVLALASCTGHDITGPGTIDPTFPLPGGKPGLPVEGPNGAVLVTCTVDAASRLMSCGGLPNGPSVAAAHDVIVGNQGGYVLIAGGTMTYTLGTDCAAAVNAAKACYSLPVTVKNLISQPMATSDGATADPNGVRVFFASGPTMTVGSGTVAAFNPTGTAIFLSSGTPYFGYTGGTLGGDAILATNETSGGVTWKFESDAGVTGFSFQVYVSAAVPKPNGYVDLALTNGGAATTATTLASGATQQLFATPKAAVGRTLDAAEKTGSVSFLSSDPAVATVDASTGLVTALGTGTATITASQTKADASVITGTLVVTVTAGAPTGMSRSAGDGQSATAGSAVATAPAVTITDAHGNGVPGVAVTFAVTGGGGSVLPATAVTTNASGVATATSWTLGNTVGANALQASATGLSTVTFTATGTVGAPAGMTKTAGDAQTAIVGTTLPTAPAVTIVDAHANPVPDLDVTFAITAGGGSFTGVATVKTNASGVATVGAWTLGTTAGSNTMTAAATGLTTLTFSATGTAAQPATITKTAGDLQTGTSGTGVATKPAVHVADQYGNPVPSVTITFAVTGGGGGVTTATPLTDASGNATVGSWTLGSGPATNTLSATASPAGTSSPVTFTAYIPTVGNDVVEAMGNTALTGSATTNVLTNDATINGGALSVTTTGALTTTRGGTVAMAADGSYSFAPAVGYPVNGRDSVQYTVTDTHASASGWLKFAFVGKVWCLVNSFGGTATGRDVSPFTSIAAAEAVAGVNDTVLVRTGSGTTAGGTLKAGQLIYAQGATTAFAATLNGANVTLLAAGTAPTIGALTLGSGNTLRGFTSSGGLTGASFGTLTVSEVAINNPAGAALSLTSGTLAGGFTSVQSGGGTNNILLSSVATSGTSVLGAAGNVLSGASGDGVVITGGAGSFTIPAHISNSASLAVNVNAKSGGTVLFSGINPSVAGRGISVTGNNVGANTITFSGTTKSISSGAAAGVTLSTNTGATIAFTGGGLAIATTTGTPFTAASGGTVEVTGSGNTISATGAAANAVNLNGITLGANGMTFASVASSGTTTGSAFSATSVANTSGSTFTAGSLTVAGTTGASSRGLALTTNSAPFTFTTASINGTGGEGIYLNGNTGAVAVNGGTVGNTSSTAGDAFAVSGGNAGITVAAALTKTSAGRIANIASHTAGTVTVSGALSCTGSCTGISLASNSGGSVDFSNASQTLTTGSSAAVTLSTNTGTTVNFSGGALAITTTSGAGLTATGGGTVTVTGNNNTVNSSGGGTAVTVSSTTIGANGLTFKRIDATGSGTNGIVLSSTGSGPFTVTGDGNSDPNNITRGRTTAKEGGGTIALGSGGSISGRSGHGISLSSTGAVTLRNMAVTGSGSSGDGINASSTGRLIIDNTRITGAAVAHGLWGSSVSGLAIYHSEIDNNATTAGVVEGPDIWNVRLLGLTGTDSIANSNIHHSQEDVVGIINTGGVLNLTVVNTNISDTGTGAGGTTNLMVQANGSSNVTLNLQNDSLNRGRARGVQTSTETAASATLNLTVNNSQFLQDGLAIENAHGSSGTNTFNITSNNIQATGATGSLQAININRLGSPSFNNFGLFTGTISGNTIGTAGVANSGSDTGSGIVVNSVGSGGTTRVAIVSNTIREVAVHGISVGETDTNNGGTTQPLLEVRIASNSIANLEAGVALDGINVLTGALNTDDEIMCIDIANNNSTGVRNGLRVRGSGSPTAPATVRLAGWDGVTARQTYFTTRGNILAGGIGAYSENIPSAPGAYVTVGSCTTP